MSSSKQTITKVWFYQTRNWKSLLSKFSKCTEKSSGCWNWIGTLNDKGYGRITVSGNGTMIQRAHQLSWLLHRGDIPAGMFICHRCDNPKCVNPDHLFLGTPKDNSIDCVRKGRIANGERQGAHRLTEDEVVAIKHRYNSEFVSARELASEYKVSSSTILRIVNGTTWRHISKFEVDSESMLSPLELGPSLGCIYQSKLLSNLGR